ncbi:MAG TPA: sigma-70 family RNA polymerase sigma factor [Opitutaceae bacterium]|nr:sigma-70 family RNA polymerase sigma factor [Opitutaceae bacterium]
MTSSEQNACFATWLDQHAAMLTHVVQGFADPSDQDDLRQDILLAIWRAVPAFRGQSQLSTFFYRVAHNAALSWRRTRFNYRQRVNRFEALSSPRHPDGAAVHEGRRESLALLYRHIRELPPLDRSLLLLHLDGVSYSDIAAIHGLTETNVGVRLNRAKKKLTESMKSLSHELR